MKNSITINVIDNPILFNLLTLPLCDEADEFTRDDIIEMINAAREELNGGK